MLIDDGLQVFCALFLCFLGFVFFSCTVFLLRTRLRSHWRPRSICCHLFFVYLSNIERQIRLPPLSHWQSYHRKPIRFFHKRWSGGGVIHRVYTHTDSVLPVGPKCVHLVGLISYTDFDFWIQFLSTQALSHSPHWPRSFIIYSALSPGSKTPKKERRRQTYPLRCVAYRQVCRHLKLLFTCNCDK